MKNTLNTIGWTGLILCLLAIFTSSCKKEENKSSSTGTPIVLTSELIGMYVSIDTDVITNDTIYIYQDGIDYKMTCPDNNAQLDKDTIIIGINNNDIIISTQYIYSTSFSITGDGLLTGTLLSLNWNTET